MIHKIRKACRAVGAAETDQARIKPGQATKQIPGPDRAHQAAVGAAYKRGTGPAENDADLAELVRKYFADEIIEAVRSKCSRFWRLNRAAQSSRQVLEKVRKMGKSRFTRGIASLSVSESLVRAAEYVGEMSLDDPAFCRDIFDVLIQHLGQMIQIGDIDLNYLL